MGTDTIIGIGSEATTPTELYDLLEPLFFLEDSVTWENITGDPNDNQNLLDLINYTQAHDLNHVFSITINHGLDRLVQVLLLDEDNEEFEAKITHIDSNTININGAPPMDGVAYII